MGDHRLPRQSTPSPASACSHRRGGFHHWARPSSAGWIASVERSCCRCARAAPGDQRLPSAGLTTKPATEASWLPAVLEKINCDPPPTAREVARDLGLHPAWLTQADRVATGEGLHQTLSRTRGERAALLLRHSADPAAQIAAEAGFCDQSHMIRCFRQLFGRTPNEVRGEGLPTFA